MLDVQIHSLRLGQHTLLQGVAVSVAAGEVVALMGPSGSGKSSLLAYIAGFLPPNFQVDGAVYLEGQDLAALPAEQRRIGLLFQDALLFPHLSVGQNLRFGMPRALSHREKQSRIRQALIGAELEGFEHRDPATLSGGQKARVAMLRALLAQPRVLLLDEPFSKLDADLRQAFRRFVFDSCKAANLPVLLVTHDQEDADASGGRCIKL